MPRGFSIILIKEWSMLLILDGSLEHVAHLWTEKDSLIDLRYLFESTVDLLLDKACKHAQLVISYRLI